MLAPRTGRALLAAGALAMLFGLSLVGIAGFGLGATPSTGSAHLNVASVAACPTTIALQLNPTSPTVGVPMVGVVSYGFSGASAHACAVGAHLVVVGLPAGCPTVISSAFSCVPTAAGAFHVQVTVFAQNTATTVLDTVVVR